MSPTLIRSHPLLKKTGSGLVQATSMPAPANLKHTLDNVIVEELHLMLRWMDRLEKGLIFEDVDWDE